ncbi:hypothetical protein CEXT_216401 [Caerostris extrusa]|uniref:Uncharacterized protein n=1 Tax=Caerostris extrusa TaxID=172846 RepID=A0AAV4Y1E5_CAEEX|nr:hypothetical protein CEXT_216401 [Caerostris extrusa]
MGWGRMEDSEKDAGIARSERIRRERKKISYELLRMVRTDSHRTKGGICDVLVALSWASTTFDGIASTEGFLSFFFSPVYCCLLFFPPSRAEEERREKKNLFASK